MTKLAEIYARRERTLKRRERRAENAVHDAFTSVFEERKRLKAEGMTDAEVTARIWREAVGQLGGDEHTRQMEELRRMRDNPNPYQTGIGAALASKLFG